MRIIFNSDHYMCIYEVSFASFPTFIDFLQERNKLMRDAFPALQRYCQSLGLDFQVVDMRWGVRDENISYHKTSEVCLQEIRLCHQLSMGPSFVVSQRTGVTKADHKLVWLKRRIIKGPSSELFLCT